MFLLVEYKNTSVVYNYAQTENAKKFKFNFFKYVSG